MASTANPTDPRVRDVRRATSRRNDAERKWREAIVSAYVHGAPSRAIGEAAGVTHVRVLQIVGEYREHQTT